MIHYGIFLWKLFRIVHLLKKFCFFLFQFQIGSNFEALEYLTSGEKKIFFGKVCLIF